MKKNFDEVYATSFIKGLTTLTGLSERKLKKYAAENNLFNVLEHPNNIEPNDQQLEKINQLNEFLSTYKILKMQEKDTKICLNTSAKAGEYFSSILGGVKNKEKFLVTFLDSSNTVIEGFFLFCYGG
jgi:DNA repair protein RadC